MKLTEPLNNKHTYWSYEKKYTKKAFLATINEINAHKNKYNTSGAKLSPTPSLI
jgi:hypothetical protein